MGSVEERLSLIVSKALDVLGYNEDLVTTRRKAYDNLSKVQTQMGKELGRDCYVTICGSKREGITSYTETDMDFMITMNNVRCSDNPASVPITDDLGYIFRLCRENVPTGYTKLRLFYKNTQKADVAIDNSLIAGPDGDLYFSSSLYMLNLKPDRILQTPIDRFVPVDRKPRAGPSNPLERVISPFIVNADCVRSFPCRCSDYLQSWTDRPRDYEWPSRELIENAGRHDAHVVPVGVKGADEEYLQWRICYTLTEVELMKSLNETQWKLYSLLRMIRDAAFRTVGDLLTSYVLKNVVMWTCEADSLDQFQPKYLLLKVRQCIDFLILGFVSKTMPSYMIRDRDLFKGKLNNQCVQAYLAVLNELLKEGPAMVLRCPKLNETVSLLYTAPEVAMLTMEIRKHEKGALFYYNLPAEDLSMLRERFRSCSTLHECIATYTEFLSERTEGLAEAIEVPVDMVTLFLQLQRTIPQEQYLSFCSTISAWSKNL